MRFYGFKTEDKIRTEAAVNLRGYNLTGKPAGFLQTKYGVLKNFNTWVKKLLSLFFLHFF